MGNTLNVNAAGAVVFNGTTFAGETLPIAYGGTNATSFTPTGIVLYDGTSLINYSGPTITSNGYLKNSRQPSFFATSSGNLLNISGNGTLYNVVLDTTLFNHSSSYNTTTHIFTAPIAGTYSFHASFYRTSKGTSTSETGSIAFTRPSLGNISFETHSDMSNSIYTLQISPIVQMDEGDTVTLNYEAFGGTKDISLVSSTTTLTTYFQGWYLG